MSTSNLKNEYVIEDIVYKLYYRWDTDKVVEYIVKKYSVPDTAQKDLEDLISKVEKEVTALRHSL